METALYLLPVTLGDTPVEKVLPAYNKEIITEGGRTFCTQISQESGPLYSY